MTLEQRAGMSRNETAPLLPAPKALLFDWDGTLVDTHAVLAKSMNQALKAFHMEPWSVEKWAEWLGASARDSFPALFGDQWEEAQDIYLEAYACNHLEDLKLKPGAHDLIRNLDIKSVYLGVVSNKTGHLLREEVDHLGLSDCFGQIIGAGDSVCDKPAADPIYLALEPSSYVADTRVWFIGDNAVDVDCGRNANCTTILLGDGYQEANPDGRVPDLVALKLLIWSAKEW